MTTDQEKLQKLFDAALRETPAAQTPAPPAPQPPPAAEPAPATPPTLQPAPAIDAGASEELARLLDEQHQRTSRRRRREALLTLLAVLGLLGAGGIWFASSPQRMQALREAVRDIRTVTDATALAAKYQDALDRISKRGNQIDEASSALGVDPSKTVPKGALDAQMKEFSGGGTSPVERAEILQKKLSKLGAATGHPSAPPTE